MKFLSILIALFITSSAMGQADLLMKKKSIYYFKNKEYKCEELGVVYKDHPKSLELYYSGKSVANISGTIGYIGLGFLVAGFGVTFTSDGYGSAAVGGLSIIVGLLFEVVALVPLSIGKNKLKKARRLFNFDMMEKHGYESNPSLSFGATGNGLGLVYQF